LKIDGKMKVREIIANVRFGSSYGNPQYKFDRGYLVD